MSVKESVHSVESLLFRHVHEKDSCNVAHSLHIANLLMVKRKSFQDIEQSGLAFPVFFIEENVLWERPSDVLNNAADIFLQAFMF